jgi:hypothetical protein
MSMQDLELVINCISSRNKRKRKKKKLLLPESLTKDEQQKTNP